MTDVSDERAGTGGDPDPVPVPTDPGLTVRVDSESETGPIQYVSQPPARPAVAQPRTADVRPDPAPIIRPPAVPPPTTERSSGPGMLLIGLGFLLGAAVVGAFFAGFLLSGGGDDESSEQAAPAAETDADADTESSEPAPAADAAETDDAGTDPAAASNAADGDADGLAAIPDPADLPEGDPEDRMSIQIETSNGGEGGATATVREDGRVHFEGAFRSQDEADRYVSRAREVFGQDAVVERYEIDPDAPAPSAGDVALDKPVLFETGSAEIHPDYIPFLEACGDVLKLNPEITMSITAFTDSVGDEEFNLDLSRRRAQAIVDFYADYQVDRAQLLGSGFGEESPIADNESEEGREQNRRAMLQLLNVMEGSSADE